MEFNHFGYTAKNHRVDFLQSCLKRCVKLIQDCYYKLGNVPTGVLERINLDPWRFLKNSKSLCNECGNLIKNV